MQTLRSVEVEAVVKFSDLFKVKAAGLKVRFSQKVEPGVDILEHIVHLRKVLRTGKYDFLSVDHQIVRTLIDAVQVVEVLFELRLSVEQMSHIFPLHQVAAPAQNEVSETGIRRLYAKDVVQRRRLSLMTDARMLCFIHLCVAE